jgi:hypothetical protein
MKNASAEIKSFFDAKILYLEDNIVDDFLNNYSVDVVLACLRKKLISSSSHNTEKSWYLGGQFKSEVQRLEVFPEGTHRDILVFTTTTVEMECRVGTAHVY